MSRENFQAAVTRADASEPCRGGRPPAATSAALAERIVNEATKLFLAQGYEATSIEQIVARVGIAKRTFYSRFSNKEALFSKVVTTCIERWDRNHKPDIPEDASLDDVLVILGNWLLERALAQEFVALHRIVNGEAPRFPMLARLLYEKGPICHRNRTAVAVFKRECARGRLKAQDLDLAVEQFTRMIVADAVLRECAQMQAFDKEDRMRRIRSGVAIFLDGCRVR